MRTTLPGVLCSDVFAAPWLDLAFDADEGETRDE